jgi:hypothetical protein
MDTNIAYYTSYDPERLTDERWAEVWMQILEIREAEAKANV